MSVVMTVKSVEWLVTLNGKTKTVRRVVDIIGGNCVRWFIDDHEAYPAQGGLYGEEVFVNEVILNGGQW